MKNALTFDVEEYFHAEAFAQVLRPEEWLAQESRVVASTERILDLLDREHVRATFFVLGWVAERQPALVRDRLAGTRDRVSRLRAPHDPASHPLGVRA